MIQNNYKNFFFIQGFFCVEVRPLNELQQIYAITLNEILHPNDYYVICLGLQFVCIWTVPNKIVNAIDLSENL